jgi:hypothetical protein
VGVRQPSSISQANTSLAVRFAEASMTKDAAPQFQPISMLSTVATVIDGGLQNARALLAPLSEARHKPHVLDDAIVDRSIAYFSEGLEFVPILTEQLKQWQETSLTVVQSKEVSRLQALIEPLRAAYAEGLALAQELSGGTIDKIMAMSDVELGLEALRTMSVKPKPR